MIVPGFFPMILEGGGGFAFSLTAGQSGNFRGYRFSFGSVNPDPPIPGQSMERFENNVSTNTAQIVFNGHILSLFVGMSVYVNGVSYGSNWQQTTISGTPYTQISWSGGTGPSFVNGVTYSIEIR